MTTPEMNRARLSAAEIAERLGLHAGTINGFARTVLRLTEMEGLNAEQTGAALMCLSGVLLESIPRLSNSDEGAAQLLATCVLIGAAGNRLITEAELPTP